MDCKSMTPWAQTCKGPLTHLTYYQEENKFSYYIYTDIYFIHIFITLKQNKSHKKSSVTEEHTFLTKAKTHFLLEIVHIYLTKNSSQ